MAGADAELAELRRQITAVRRERQDRARRLPVRSTFERAVAEAEREVDALTSSKVEVLRRDVEQLSERLRMAWADADWVRLARLRIMAAGIDFDALAQAPQLLAALEDEAAGRAALTAKAAEAGLALRVPEPLDLEVPLNPNRDRVREAMAEHRHLLADRELHRARATTRREPDRHAR